MVMKKVEPSTWLHFSLWSRYRWMSRRFPLTQAAGKTRYLRKSRFQQNVAPSRTPIAGTTHDDDRFIARQFFHPRVQLAERYQR
jgi:hypothetical protein